MKRLLPSILFGLTAIVFAGCVSPQPNSEFVKSVDFSSLQTFSYKHTLTSGMDFRGSDKLFLEDVSEAMIQSEMASRGFDIVEEDADFYAVVKWRKAMSYTTDPFQRIDGPYDSFVRNGSPSHTYAARLDLTLEIYESSTNNLFWRKEMSNVFDILQLTQVRVESALQEAVKNFPSRVVRDPNLPNIE